MSNLLPKDQHNIPDDAAPTSHDSVINRAIMSTATFHADEAVGTVIGSYRLLQQLGKGGMGLVWLAEQTEPVKRRVALKIIKADLRGDQVLARFEAERQALALMDHPNIAKVLDAGTTKSGRSYFVMELVKGIPFTEYCDQERLQPRERLELFIPICHAVQHAHQKGIIHRDLKPSNVLVANYDGKPVPKIIDFGIAKATHQKLTELTMYTEIGMMVGTLEYMAPEQAELNNLDIDPRADIYSLGVMLYESLTGALPFSAEQLRDEAFLEMLRLIRDEEPARPSKKLSNSTVLSSIAAKRNLEPKTLIRMVRGDLDWIVMKCLEKERRRRYETADQLAQDLQRFLANQPVQAGPPSLWYRVEKFVQRHPEIKTWGIAFICIQALVTMLFLFLGRNENPSRDNAENLDRSKGAESNGTESFSKQKLIKVNDLYILAIGVSKYTNHESKYPTAVYDACDLIDAFKNLEGDGKGKLFARVSANVLINEKATCDGIKSALKALRFEPTTEESLVIVTFSGRGHKDQDRKKAYIFHPFDFNDAEEDFSKSNGLSFVDLIDSFVVNFPCPVILILDSGESGAATIDRVYRERLAVISACAGDGPAWQRGGPYGWGKQGRGHGALTLALLEGLYGEHFYVSGDIESPTVLPRAGGGGVVTLAEVNRYIKHRVFQLTREGRTDGDRDRMQHQNTKSTTYNLALDEIPITIKSR